MDRHRAKRGQIGAFDGGIIEVVKVVQNRHSMSQREAFLNKMRPNEPRPACHKDVHGAAYADAKIPGK
jgi:hypothetical protein